MNEDEYQKIKQEKWDKHKQNLLKDLGQIPLGFYLLITSIILGIVTSIFFFIISNIEYNQNLIFGFPLTLIIVYSTISTIMTIFYFGISLIFLDWYDESRKLNKEDK